MKAWGVPSGISSSTAAAGNLWTRSNASGVPNRSPIPCMTRLPLPGGNSANLTDELPELSTSTKPPELPPVAWSGLAPVVGILGMLTLRQRDPAEPPQMNRVRPLRHQLHSISLPVPKVSSEDGWVSLLEHIVIPALRSPSPTWC